MKTIDSNEEETNIHIMQSSLQRVKVMSFRGHCWHTVVLPEDGFARENYLENYLYPSV